MGEVWLAWDEVDSVERAVKLPSQTFARDLNWRMDMKREAQVLRHLSHPAIAAFHDFVVEEERCGLVMEYVPGRTLRALLDAEGRRDRVEALRIAAEIASALDEAHRHPQRIVHCDLKPANVMIAADGAVKVLDWGIARSELAETSAAQGSAGAARAITAAPVRFGTPGYLPPEVLLGDRRTTRAVDIFAFGSVLFELLSGSRAFPGRNAGERIERTLDGPPDFALLPGDLPSPLWSLLRRLLEFDVRVRCGDIADAIEVLRPDGARPGRSRRAGGNLPAVVGAVVGRESEQADLVLQLRRVRFVALHGIGGMGKTRLALSVAHEIARDAARGEELDGGAWFVPIEHVGEDGLVLEAIARAMGSAAGSVAELARQIGERRTLLVLDRCDDRPDAVASVVSALLAAAPNLRVLATGRMPIDGATPRRIGPLRTLGAIAERGDAALRDLESVRLFVARVRSDRPRFEPGEAQLRAIAELVTRLDGIPGSIEIAASFVGSETFESLRVEADSVGDRRDDGPFVAMIEWSLSRLRPEHRLLLSALAAFPAGFELDASLEVGAAAGLERASIQPLLGALVDHALVEIERPEGRVRYRLLRAVRRIAEQLVDAETSASISEGFNAWCRGLVEGAGPTGEAPLERLLIEWPNIAAAIESTLDRGRIEDAATMTVALHRLWYRCGLQGEGLEIVRRVAERRATLAPGPPESAGEWWLVQARLRNAAGLLAWIGRRCDVAEGEFLAAMSILERIGEGEPSRRAAVLSNRALLAKDKGDLAAAGAMLAEARAWAQAVGDSDRAAQAAVNAAVVQEEAGDLDGALRSAEECIRTLGGKPAMKEFLTEAEFVRGLVFVARGEMQEAGAALRRALELNRGSAPRMGATGEIHKAPQLLWGVSRFAERRGDLGAAATLRLGAARLSELLRIQVRPMESEHGEATERLRLGLGLSAWEDAAARAARSSASELLELAFEVTSITGDDDTLTL